MDMARQNDPPVPSGYNVHRETDRDAMLQAIGVTSVDELFETIPLDIRLNRPLNVPAPVTEWQLVRHLKELAGRNATTVTHLSFLGGGAYDHHIPAVVETICGRGEFLTAYTPYQPEMSQGLLQVLFEYQKLAGLLTGLPSVNCSLYDGSVALAEAAWMACSIRELRQVVVADTLWPQSREVLDTYMKGRGVEVVTCASDTSTGRLDIVQLEKLTTSHVAAVIVQSPNCYGVIEDLKAIRGACDAHGTFLNVSAYPLSLGVLKPPGDFGADIVTCEGQSLGIPLAGGGPYLGILSTHKKHERFMPGRLVGRVTDLRGNLAYALIKEDREQHVSREKATSHICSNQALQAMRAAVYLACVGERGFREIASQNAAKARYLRERLLALPGIVAARSGAFFNEFALHLPVPTLAFLAALEKRGIFGGIAIGDRELLVAVTEKRAKSELDSAVKAFGDCLQEAAR